MFIRDVLPTLLLVIVLLVQLSVFFSRKTVLISSPSLDLARVGLWTSYWGIVGSGLFPQLLFSAILAGVSIWILKVERRLERNDVLMVVGGVGVLVYVNLSIIILASVPVGMFVLTSTILAMILSIAINVLLQLGSVGRIYSNLHLAVTWGFSMGRWFFEHLSGVTWGILPLSVPDPFYLLPLLALLVPLIFRGLVTRKAREKLKRVHGIVTLTYVIFVAFLTLSLPGLFALQYLVIYLGAFSFLLIRRFGVGTSRHLVS